MALTNAEKQRAWRQRHAERRRAVAQIASMLMRRSHTDGEMIEGPRIGWNAFGVDVKYDAYFLRLAVLLAKCFSQDNEIKQLRWALEGCLRDRKSARRHKRDIRKYWLETHPHMGAKDYRRWRDTDEMTAWREAEKFARWGNEFFRSGVQVKERALAWQAIAWVLDG